ncbi:MAG: hypothetical protein CBC34_005915, partial [Hyphomicrobiaceae bacterium TMED74]
SRFKGWMARFKGVASKYLPSYLGWRRMIERDGERLTPRQRHELEGKTTSEPNRAVEIDLPNNVRFGRLGNEVQLRTDSER